MPAQLRPGFGPSLPALVHARFGIAPRTTVIALLALVLALGTAALAAWWLARDPQLVHRGDPVFNLVYDDDALRVAEPEGDQLVRLEGRRRRVSVSIDIRPLSLPAFDGDVAKGLLPVQAELYVQQLRERHPHFVLREEGRSTVNESPGYQVVYRTGPPGDRHHWREIFVVPDEEAPRSGVVIRFENDRPARLRPREAKLVKAAKSAYRSFNFGTERG
ncbi:MAG TPA: hypothetical protein VGR12_00775 [Solirubrobacteraceae bacterium]|nr:hypothetical protein [Solirubrobacteraceae bacterium]